MTRMLRLPMVMERVGFGRSQIYKMIQRGEFPAPVKLSSQVSGWEESKIEEWLQGKIRKAQGR